MGINTDNIRDFLIGLFGLVCIVTALYLAFGARKGNVREAGNALGVIGVSAVIAGIGVSALFITFGTRVATGLFG